PGLERSSSRYPKWSRHVFLPMAARRAGRLPFFLKVSIQRRRSGAQPHPAPEALALFGGLLRLRRVDHPGLEIGRRHDLQHLEILRAGDLAMGDAGDLVDA